MHQLGRLTVFHDPLNYKPWIDRKRRKELNKPVKTINMWAGSSAWLSEVVWRSADERSADKPS